MELDIHKLSGDTARMILKSLLAQEHINTELMLSAMKHDPSNELCRLTDSIHTMFCQEHAKQSCICSYYDEESDNASKTECWSQEHHARWLDKTFSLMEEFELASEADFTKLYGKVREAQEYLAKVKSSTPNVYKMLCRLNGWKED